MADDWAQALYPQPKIKWYPDMVDEHPSILGAFGVHVPVSPDSAVPVRVVSAGPCQELCVAVVRVIGLLPPSGNLGAESYYVTAFYPGESDEVCSSRRTPSENAFQSLEDPVREEVSVHRNIALPYNSRQQFVKIAVHRVHLAGDELVGEATVPIADPNVAVAAPWPLMLDFEEQGEVMLSVHLPGDEPPFKNFGEEATQVCETPHEPGESHPVSPATSRQKSAEPHTHGFSVGDLVEVYSKSGQGWVRARVARVHRSGMTVESNGKTKDVDFELPNLNEIVRRVTTHGQTPEPLPSRGRCLRRDASHPLEPLDASVRSRASSGGRPSHSTLHGSSPRTSGADPGRVDAHCQPNVARTPSGHTVRTGDKVHVLSKSGGGWNLATVISVSVHEVELEYRDRRRTVDLREPNLHAYFRLANHEHPSAAHSHGYRVGDSIEVFSATANQWVQAVVVTVQQNEISVEYGDRGRRIDIRDEASRDLVRRPRNCSPSREDSTRQGGPPGRQGIAPRAHHLPSWAGQGSPPGPGHLFFNGSPSQRPARQRHV